MKLDVFGVDFGDHQRNVVFHAERARIVDHHRAGLDHKRPVLAGDVAARAEERDVDSLERVVGHLFDHHILAAELHSFAGGTGGCQKFEVLDRKIPFLERLDHFDAHRAGRTCDRYIVTVRHIDTSLGELGTYISLIYHVP